MARRRKVIKQAWNDALGARKEDLGFLARLLLSAVPARKLEAFAEKAAQDAVEAKGEFASDAKMTAILAKPGADWTPDDWKDFLGWLIDTIIEKGPALVDVLVLLISAFAV